MKNLLLSSIAFLFTMVGVSQTVEGSIKINEKSNFSIELKSNKAVDLYVAFRNNEYPILFRFTGKDIPLNDQKQEVIPINFKTTVKYNGKIAGQIVRQPMPFFPGDMWMPVETFDFISILSTIQNNDLNQIATMPVGNYEITIEAQTNKIKGKIQPLLISFKVN